MNKGATKIKLAGGLEYDGLASDRRVYCSFSKPGAAKYVKRKYNRRFRATNKIEIRKEITGI